MKLAEALLLRSEYQKMLERLKNRVLSNIKVQEGDKPLENPEELIKETFELSERLCELVNKINSRNVSTKLPSGQTLSEALARRDTIIKNRNFLNSIIGTASQKDHRLTRSEIKMNVAISVAETQKQIDDLSKEFRELDVQIQALNWTTDL